MMNKFPRSLEGRDSSSVGAYTASFPRLRKMSEEELQGEAARLQLEIDEASRPGSTIPERVKLAKSGRLDAVNDTVLAVPLDRLNDAELVAHALMLCREKPGSDEWRVALFVAQVERDLTIKVPSQKRKKANHGREQSRHRRQSRPQTTGRW